MHSHLELLEKTSEYWKSPKGIRKRIEMIGEGFTFQLVNNALQAYGTVNNVKGFEWVGSLDELTCPYCATQIGRYYRVGQFLPSLPAHLNCRCEWRLIPR